MASLSFIYKMMKSSFDMEGATPWMVKAMVVVYALFPKPSCPVSVPITHGPQQIVYEIQCAEHTHQPVEAL